MEVVLCRQRKRSAAGSSRTVLALRSKHRTVPRVPLQLHVYIMPTIVRPFAKFARIFVIENASNDTLVSKNFHRRDEHVAWKKRWQE